MWCWYSDLALVKHGVSVRVSICGDGEGVARGILLPVPGIVLRVVTPSSSAGFV